MAGDTRPDRFHIKQGRQLVSHHNGEGRIRTGVLKTDDIFDRHIGFQVVCRAVSGGETLFVVRVIRAGIFYAETIPGRSYTIYIELIDKAEAVEAGATL